MSKDLKSYVCVVTGASRGIGRGIAVVLGEYGATVYVTARTLEPKDQKAGSLKEVVEEINKRGGVGIAVPLDHNDETQIANLFTRVKKEQNGRLDLFVNSAFSGVPTVLADMKDPRDGFWTTRANESPGDYWDTFHKVGLRNAYICCCYAAKVMLEYRGQLEKKASRQKAAQVVPNPGLIVNVSSAGSAIYLFNSAYTASKAASDKMTLDMALELKRHGADLSVMSLWPGPVATEEVVSARDSSSAIKKLFNPELSETTELSGRVIAHLLRQSKRKIMGTNGCIVQTASYARNNWIRDANGKYALPVTSVKFMLKSAGWNKLAYFVPSFIRIPDFVVKLGAMKFY